jgi:hypothetical protein
MAPGNAPQLRILRRTGRPAGQVFRRSWPRSGLLFAAQDKVAVRLRFRGTHSGEFLGFGSTGRTIEYVSHEFYRIADGLIAEEWICSDMAMLLRQLSVRALITCR